MNKKISLVIIIFISIIIISIISIILYIIFKKPSKSTSTSSVCNFYCKNGICNNNDVCICNKGYKGSDCSVKCCSNNGVCKDDGTCMCDPQFTGVDCKTCKTPFYSNNKTGGCDLVFPYNTYDKLIKCFLTFSFIDEYKNYYPSDVTSNSNIYTYYFHHPDKGNEPDLKRFYAKPDDYTNYDFSWQNKDILTDFSNSPGNPDNKISQLNSKTGTIDVKYKLSKNVPITFDIYHDNKVIGTVEVST